MTGIPGYCHTSVIGRSSLAYNGSSLFVFVTDTTRVNEEWNMNIQASIERKLNLEFRPNYQLIENESHLHGGGTEESHFKLTVVSEDFAGLNRVRRHQSVYALLADEMAGPIHALALHLYSPAEWAERANGRPDSPDCRGGSRFD
tara:strand:+ start:1575 stop:2009 length:435 start_codon:yes stop_codon:yes gene_type:complete